MSQWNGTIFCDLDGTILIHGTGDLCDGVREWLDLCTHHHYRVIFVTRRGNKEWGADHPKYSEAVTRAQLAAHNLGHYEIIFDVMSPRVLVDDSHVVAISMRTDQGFSPELLRNWDETMSRHDRRCDGCGRHMEAEEQQHSVEILGRMWTLCTDCNINKAKQSR